MRSRWSFFRGDRGGVSSGDSPRSRRRRSYPDAASTSAIASPGDPSPPARPSRSRRRAVRGGAEREDRRRETSFSLVASRRISPVNRAAGGSIIILNCRSRFAIPRRRRAPQLGTFISGNLLSSDGTGRSQFDANLSRWAIRSRRFSPASCRFTRCPPPRAARFDRPGITPCASPATRAPWCARAFGTPRASSDGL